MTQVTRPLKVMQIASGDQWAGAEAQLYTLTNALHTMPDITVEVILLNHGRLEEELGNAGIKVTIIDEAKLNGFKILFKLVTALRDSQPDVIHTHRLKENILGSIASKFSGNIPSLRTTHGATEHKPSWYQPAKGLILFIDWFCGRYLQKTVVAVSQDLANILQQSFPARKIAVIENGIDIDTLTQKIDPEKQQAESSPIRIGIIGRLVAVKRVDIFIKAAQYLKQTIQEAKLSFHIFGSGPLQEELIQLSKEQQTDDIIHFEGHSDDIDVELQNLDILLMTSDHEGLPMVLLEAMVLNTPIISHAVGGIPELLDHGHCGLLVAEHTPEGYAEKTMQLIASAGLRDELAQRAATRVKEKYSAEKNASSYASEYKKIARD